MRCSSETFGLRLGNSQPIRACFLALLTDHQLLLFLTSPTLYACPKHQLLRPHHFKRPRATPQRCSIRSQVPKLSFDLTTQRIRTRNTIRPRALCLTLWAIRTASSKLLQAIESLWMSNFLQTSISKAALPFRPAATSTQEAPSRQSTARIALPEIQLNPSIICSQRILSLPMPGFGGALVTSFAVFAW